MAQISIGQIETCGMCRFNRICHRIMYDNGNWEVYDWGKCTKLNKEVMYYEKCQFYETIDKSYDTRIAKDDLNNE